MTRCCSWCTAAQRVVAPCMLCRLGLSPGIHSSSQTLQLSEYQLPPVLDLICGLSAHLTGSKGSHAVCRPPAPQQPLELVRLQHFNLQVSWALLLLLALSQASCLDVGTLQEPLPHYTIHRIWVLALGSHLQGLAFLDVGNLP